MYLRGRKAGDCTHQKKNSINQKLSLRLLLRKIQLPHQREPFVIPAFRRGLPPPVAVMCCLPTTPQGVTSLPKATSLGEADITCPQGQISFGFTSSLDKFGKMVYHITVIVYNIFIYQSNTYPPYFSTKYRNYFVTASHTPYRGGIIYHLISHWSFYGNKHQSY